MNKKKKLLALALAVCLIAIVSFTTLAYFTDSDSVTNTFTVGSIEIETVEEFTQNSQLIPVGSNATPEDDPNFVKKVVSVKNTGKNDAYVRTFVAVPAALDNGLLHIHDTGAAANGWVKVAVGTTTIGTTSYNVYRYTQQNVVTAGTQTAALMTGVYIDQAADINIYRDDAGNITAAYFVWGGNEITGFNVASMTLDVYVVTQAVQERGFTSADSALTSAFGDALPVFN